MSVSEETEAELDFEPELVGRRLTLPKDLWEEIVELAARTGAHPADVIVALIRVGMQADSDGLTRPLRKHVVGTQTMLEINGKVRRVITCSQVPPVGEILGLDGENYVVVQRAWNVHQDTMRAYLRLEPYGQPAGKKGL